MSSSEKRQLILMDSARIKSALHRISIQLIEHLNNEDSFVIIGLNESGYSVAKMLSTFLEQHTSIPFECCQFHVNIGRVAESVPDCNDKQVFLVDDVIYSGKTMFDALSAVCAAYNPESIVITTLIDRGHRKFPLKSDMTGLNVPTKEGEHIEVIISQGKPDQAVLFKN